MPVALWAAPALVFAVTLPWALHLDLLAIKAEPPTYSVVGERTSDERISVEASVTKGSVVPPTVASAGLVTAVYVKVGKPVASASPVLQIDGVDALAQIGGKPFYRPLAQGDVGWDVEALNAYLGVSGANDRYTWATRAAVRGLQARIGAPTDGTFQPSYFVFIPLGSEQPETTDAKVGSSIAPGDAVYQPQAGITSISFKPVEDSGSLEPLRGKALSVIAAGNKVEIADLTATADEIVAIETLIEEGLSSNILTLGGEPTGNVTVVRGLILALAEPYDVGTVPGSAIFVSSTGTLCVFVRATASSKLRAVDIKDVESSSREVGIAFVPKSIVGYEVVVNANSAEQAVRSQCK